jgi:hypothetical protein
VRSWSELLERDPSRASSSIPPGSLLLGGVRPARREGWPVIRSIVRCPFLRNKPYRFCYLSSALDPKQAPLPGDALEFVFTAILKFDAGANHEVLDGARDKNLAR